MRTRGSALLSALFIMTLITIVITELSYNLQTVINRTHLIINADTRFLAAQGVLYWAMDELSRTKTVFVAKDDLGTIKFLPKSYAKLYPHITLQGKIIDLQSRFNINNLTNPESQVIFNTLLTLTHTSNINAKDITQYLTHNANNKPQLLQDITEYPPFKTITRLNNFITALPTSTTINVNTANKTILMALGLTIQQTNQILALRKEQSGLKTLTNIQHANLKAEIVGTDSRYFLIIATAKQPYITQTWHIILERVVDQKNNISLHILRHGFTGIY